VALYRLLARQWFASYAPRLATELLRCAVYVPAFHARYVERAAFAEEAVDICRRLAAVRPGADDQQLARALVAVAGRLAAVGSPVAALAAVDEAIDLYGRGVAPTVDDVMGLAAACEQRALLLAVVGRVDEAVTFAEEAVSLYRRCPAGVPTTATAAFASALDSLAACLGQVERHQEAVVAAQEAVGRYAELPRREQRRQLVYRIRAETRLARELRLVGRYEEAIGPGKEAADELQLLTVFYPLLLPLRAQGLLNIARCYGRLERFAAGKAAAQEGVMVCRRLVAKQPEVYQAELADALFCLSQQFRGLSAHAEQRMALEESAEIRRRLVGDGAEAAELGLVDTLAELASACEAGQDSDAAVERLREAMTVLRGLVHDDLAYELDLARTVEQFCFVLRRQGRHEEEVTARAEALEIYERLVAVRTDCDHKFANALLAQAEAYGFMYQHREAVQVWTRLLALFNAQTASKAAGMEEYVAVTLRARAEQLAALENYDESLADIEAAIQILRDLATPTAPANQVAFAYTLQIATRHYLRSGRAVQALRACDELRELAREANQSVITGVYTATFTHLRQEMPGAIENEGPQVATADLPSADAPDAAHES
jgi:tetratricopeptide (TPR) repeat protein